LKKDRRMPKTILVTGSTDGIGFVSAAELAKKGFKVIIHGRNALRAEEAKKKIQNELGGNLNLETVEGELSSFASVRKMASEILKRFERIDVLLNNAGVFMPQLVITEDGYEATFQINYLSHFLLTLLLFKIIPKGSGRIINVSSMAHSSVPLDFNNLRGEKSYDPYDAYSRSKLANILFTYKLAREIKATGITVNALHPGVIATKLLAAGWGATFGTNVERGAETSIFLATSENVKNITGKYFSNKRETRSSEVSYDEKLQDELWEFSLRATGLDVNNLNLNSSKN
jgi:NAD(P)-dependent dehydrogenase (short-subunit alcohol dehydrogenase family)